MRVIKKVGHLITVTKVIQCKCIVFFCYLLFGARDCLAQSNILNIDTKGTDLHCKYSHYRGFDITEVGHVRVLVSL